MKTKSLILIFLLIPFSCNFLKPAYYENLGKLSHEGFKKIEFSNSNNENCKTNFKDFSVEYTQEIENIVSLINYSTQDKYRETNCFNEIRLVSKDSVITLYTNGKIFGHEQNGMFYKFKQKNTIEEIRKTNNIRKQGTWF